MTPQKVEIKRLPEMSESEFFAFSVESEAVKFCEQINQPRYYWYAPNQTYYVPVIPGQKVAPK